ncbi:hypothetical protein QO206_16280 [Leeuwenhoekiella aequorea]|uniref:hypothetical protein n=1 Tax=Leeuwenhoekiella aequorea TaxID=283736 RepID=UPI00352D70DD
MRLLFIICLFIPGFLIAQDSIVVSASELGKKISLQADTFVGVDSYQSLYYIKNKTLHKENAGTTIQFSDLQLGTISDVDLLNPLRITLFYAETNTAVILDNTLNEISRIQFNELENFRNISHARTASDRRLWVFNVDAQRLELYDYLNNTFITDFTPQNQNALALTNDYNTCWVRTTDTLYQYNQYGSLLSKQPINKLGDFQYSKGEMIAVIDDTLSIRPINSKHWSPIKYLPEDIKAFYLNAGILYLYHSDLISTYKLNLPKF